MKTDYELEQIVGQMMAELFCQPDECIIDKKIYDVFRNIWNKLCQEDRNTITKSMVDYIRTEFY